MTDQDLEQEFRDALRRRADDVSTPPGLVAHAGRSPRRRRRVAVLTAVGAAAAVVVVTVAVQALPSRDGQEQGVSDPGVAGGPTPAITPDAPSPAATVAGWRVEAWHGLQVSVPSDWGWGTTPMDTGAGADPAFCGGIGAVLGADEGRSTGDRASDVPYVGRPILLSDACQVVDGPLEPTAPYVWLGADLPAGTMDVGNGYTQQTVQVDGTTLTVGSADPALRQRIIDSAQPVSACPATLAGALPTAEFASQSLEGTGRAVVCAYRRDQSGPLQLAYEADLDGAAATTYLTQASAPDPTMTAPQTSCLSNQVVVARFYGRGTDPGRSATRQVVADLTCGWLNPSPEWYARLDAATRAALTGIGGLPVVLPPSMVPRG